MPQLSEAQRHELFPVTREWAYFDNARRGPISAPAAAAAVHYVEGLRDGGVTKWGEWQRVWDETQSAFGKFVVAGVDELCFLVNATEAFARVTLGIDWKPGDHAVVPARDYPGIVRPVLDLRRRGVEVTLVPDRADHSRPVGDLLAAITPRTRLVAASWLDYRTGWKLDAQALAQGCRKRGVLCALDAVQAVGAFPIDIREVGCDFATFEIRKYLCGLDTLGILYVRREALGMLTPHSQGLFSVVNPFDFEAMEQPLADGAKRFMLGTPALVQVYSLQAALKLHGQHPVFARVAEVVRATRDAITGAGYHVHGADWPEVNRSHLLSVKREGKLLAEDLQARLTAAKVSASPRGAVLRVSPHWYNSASDIERLLAVIVGSEREA